MTTTDSIWAAAEHLLRRDAEELRESSTSSRDRDDWTGEEEAKADYDEHIAAADALSSLSTAEPVPTGEYPPLPVRYAYDDEGNELFSTAQMFNFVDADRAMRAQAAPAAAAGQCEDAIELLSKYKELCEEIKRGDSYHLGRIDSAISVLAQAAPQPAVHQGKPVAWRSWDSENSRWNLTLWPDEWVGHADVWEPLYTNPAAPAAQGDALQLDAIRQAIRDYHFALDQRQHGGVAEGAALSAIESVLGTGWKQGAEAAARAAKEGAKP